MKVHLPSKQRRGKKSKQPAWINDDIISAINKRDHEPKMARKSNNLNDWAKFKGKSGYVTNLIKKSKRCDVLESFDENNGSPK